MSIFSNKCPILYISGWGVQILEDRLFQELQGLYETVIPFEPGTRKDLPEILNELSQIITEYNPVIVALSWGCFLTSHFNQPSVLINPCLYPSRTIQQVKPDVAPEIVTLLRAAEISRGKKKLDIWFSIISVKDELISIHYELDFTTVPSLYVPEGAHTIEPKYFKDFIYPVIRKALRLAGEVIFD